MLMLILNMWVEFTETKFNLNTSHVNVNLQQLLQQSELQLNLNTSHVNVNQICNFAK